MRSAYRSALALLLLVSTSVGQEPSADIPDALQRYVAKPEPVYQWRQIETHETEQGNVHQFHLVSQTWQDIVWEHALLVYEPQRIDHPDHMLLMVTGGRNGRTPDRDDFEMGLGLAQLCGARIATLHQVPNQPLLGDHVEDDLITETWLKYLETGDDSWPLLFPMVKSAHKAMDALQEIARDEWDEEIEGFVITGGSKRGWTSWLTPVADDRVLATAPLVIDTLNFHVQTQHQLDTWGEFSEQIYDYTSKGLVKTNGEQLSPREQQLWRMMDPYTYRQQLTLPKLLVCGTNDRYWVVNAMNNYWDELVGPKYILQVPNAGHGLDGGRELAMTTVGVFFRHTALGVSLPEIDWSHSNGGDQMQLSVTSSEAPVAVRLWTAVSDTNDFRESEWSAESLMGADGEFVGTLPVPETGQRALFGELQFDASGLKYSLTTLVYTSIQPE